MRRFAIISKVCISSCGTKINSCIYIYIGMRKCECFFFTIEKIKISINCKPNIHVSIIINKASYFLVLIFKKNILFLIRLGALRRRGRSCIFHVCFFFI